MRTFYGLLACALCTTPITRAEAKAPAWQELYSKDGFTISALERRSSSLPIVRADGIIHENMYEVLAVLNDVSRHTEWMYSLKESDVISRESPFDFILYGRFNAPWPVSDRDTVMHITIEVEEDQEIVRMAFTGIRHPAHPPKRGVVRTPRLRNRAVLRYVEPHKTYVRYWLDIDPGGSLPRWFVRWALTKLPLRFLKRLNKQIKKTRGQYTEFLDTYDPRRREALKKIEGPPLPPQLETEMSGAARIEAATQVASPQ